MKRLLFVLFIAVALFVSCEGPMGPQGLEGEPGGKWEEMSFVVRPNEWRIPTYPDGSTVIPGTPEFYYYRAFPWEALDEFAVERGIVIGYVEDFMGNYTTLPYVFHDKDAREWTVTTSLSFYRGGFEIQVTNSDFEDVRPLKDMVFRVIIFK
jgi:hypothetical protein